MEGLRTLNVVDEHGGTERTRMFIYSSDIDLFGETPPPMLPCLPCGIAQIWPNLYGAGAEFRASDLEEARAYLLADFLERGYSSSDVIPHGSKPSESTATGVKIAIIPSGDSSAADMVREQDPLTLLINIEEEHFIALWKALTPHPRLANMILHRIVRGFEFIGRTVDNQGVSGHLATPKARFFWTIRQHEQSSNFDVRCIFIFTLSAYNNKPNWTDWRVVMRYLRAFKEDSHSPLYLPFAISAYALEECRHQVSLLHWRVMRWYNRDRSGKPLSTMDIEREMEEDEVQRMSMLDLIRGNIPMDLEVVETDLNSIESLWNYLVLLAKELPDTAKSEAVCRSNESILAALYYLQQELKGLRDVVRSTEKQVNNFMSMRSHYLNQKDADRNVKMAKTTHELAQAARQDSSAMKTIAVLTMAFLPATFLATLLSMPSLNWDQRKHFVIYWILAIPITVATFVLWALVTQRQQVRKWLKHVHASLRRRNRARKEQTQRKRKEMERQRATNDEAPGKV